MFSDLNIFVFLVVLIFILGLFGLLKEKVEWSVFPGFGVVLGIFFHTALLSDGSITQVSGGTVTAIASASADVASVWQAISFVPFTMTMMCFLIAVYRVGKSFD